jgi:hypothetical protein
MSNLMKIHPVGSVLIHADRQTDGQTDKTTIIVTFHNFLNVPKNGMKQSFEVIHLESFTPRTSKLVDNMHRHRSPLYNSNFM